MKRIAYWITTALLVFGVLSGGVAELARRPDNVDGILRLGYPLYFVTIIGFWKVLGSLALLAPGLARLKEWAYAGVFLNMTGAVASHLASADPIGHVIAPAVFVLLTLASWALRPQSRTLGVAS